ncbi:MAG: GNAT family N-acetyltransferase [Thermomicrobiales bacterium]
MTTAPEFVIESLGAHDRSGFTCGVAALDRYFRQQAGQDHRRRAAIVFVAIDPTANDAVVGFYTLSAAQILARDLPEQLVRKLPRYPELPAILLGRLAVDQRWQGRQLGRLLITDALLRCARLDQIGALFLLVDAIDQNAEQYYLRLGFRALPDQPSRLYFPLDDLRRSQRT